MSLFLKLAHRVGGAVKDISYFAVHFFDLGWTNNLIDEFREILVNNNEKAFIRNNKVLEQSLKLFKLESCALSDLNYLI